MAAGNGNWWIFVDTNIFLDFYRQPGPFADRQLKALGKHKDTLITGDQIRMEFFKNRQKVINLALTNLKKPAIQQLPQFLVSLKPSKAFNTQQKALQSNLKK